MVYPLVGLTEVMSDDEVEYGLRQTVLEVLKCTGRADLPHVDRKKHSRCRRVILRGISGTCVFRRQVFPERESRLS